MAMRDNTARNLLAASELPLYESSRGTALTALDLKSLEQKARRSRSLRDKYRDRGQQQRREERGKGAARGRSPAAGNARTQDKATLFSEILERYQARLEKVQQMCEHRDAAAAKAVAKKAAKAKATQQRNTQARTIAKAVLKNAKAQAAGKATTKATAETVAKPTKAKPDKKPKTAKNLTKVARKQDPLRGPSAAVAGARRGHYVATGARNQARRDNRS